ncbi:unnamed protein product [Cylicocyclus nassatus]|uniref:Ground-like domain-containing protein n=1 Tax=Cylicocyclus nassatus TaxID=53992 RepID=A0AA36GUL1_CYLNA|nr:unnamed protein product [Cylicocyclus nassatus]
MILPLILLVACNTSSAFLFGSSKSACSCPCEIIACPIYPTCPPVQNCPEQKSDCCPTCECQKKERVKRNAAVLSHGVYAVNSTVVSHGREQLWTRKKRDVHDEVVKIDANCNNEDLRSIIIENIDRITSLSKRRIQTEAEKRLGGRYNVICARGDFSYITNTEQYCQQTVGDVTCYAFKQLSDAIRARLA